MGIRGSKLGTGFSARQSYVCKYQRPGFLTLSTQ